MAYTLIHNSGCGTSRQGLALLEDAGVEVTVRKYTTVSGRLSLDEIKELARKMGNVSPRKFLREKDAVKVGLPDSASDEDVFAAMAENPRLIQRPIGVVGDKAVLGRPKERLLDLL